METRGCVLAAVLLLLTPGEGCVPAAPPPTTTITPPPQPTTGQQTEWHSSLEASTFCAVHSIIPSHHSWLSWILHHTPDPITNIYLLFCTLHKRLPTLQLLVRWGYCGVEMYETTHVASIFVQQYLMIHVAARCWLLFPLPRYLLSDWTKVSIDNKTIYNRYLLTERSSLVPEDTLTIKLSCII